LVVGNGGIMSKQVKDLITRDIAERLKGVGDALLVNVVGIDANSTVTLRKQLSEKNIHLLVVKNSLAKRATEGTPLAAAFTGVEGTLAVVWGAEDFVSLAKQISELDKGKTYEKFETRGGVMDGERLTPERVQEISKWPSRTEQLSILMGQILSPGANLAGALLGPGGALASQLKQIADGEAGGSADAGAGDSNPPPSAEPAEAAAP
jgi:ribosomal protein L10